jgi:hypothetical protein
MRVSRRHVFGVLLALVLVPAAAVAQETSLGFYLVPKVGTGTALDPFRPKYIGDLAGVQWSAMDLGIEPTFIVGANLSAAQHTSVSGQSDVFAFPANIDGAVGGNPTLNRVRNGLEQRNIPGADIASTWTWRQVIGRVGDTCLILQRLNGQHQTRLFPPGVSLDSQPDQPVFEQLVSVGQSFGLTTSTLSIALTVRENLLRLSDQLPGFTLGGEVF